MAILAEATVIACVLRILQRIAHCQMGTKLMITNPRTGRSVRVVIGTRGPFVRGRSLDIQRLSLSGSLKLWRRVSGLKDNSTARLRKLVRIANAYRTRGSGRPIRALARQPKHVE